MKTVRIRFPIWKKPRSIGIAKYKITSDLKIEILHRDKNGDRIYPDPFYISKERILAYPTQRLEDHGVLLHIVPIRDLDMVPPELPL